MTTLRRCDVCDQVTEEDQRLYSLGRNGGPELGWTTIDMTTMCDYANREFAHRRTYDVCYVCLEKVENVFGARRRYPEIPEYFTQTEDDA